MFNPYANPQTRVRGGRSLSLDHRFELREGDRRFIMVALVDEILSNHEAHAGLRGENRFFFLIARERSD
jgi:hypothetical protein